MADPIFYPPSQRDFIHTDQPLDWIDTLFLLVLTFVFYALPFSLGLALGWFIWG